jgi:hypothetical protein
MKKIRAVITVCIALILLLSACNYPTPTPTEPVVGTDFVKTAAAQTIQAMITQMTQSPQNITPTAPKTTLPPTPTGGSATITVPTNTLIPTPTQVTPVIPCDRARLDGETIPDGTVKTPGAVFIKTWTLTNTGTCTWDSNYSVVFIKGEAMDGPAAKQLTTGQVTPGQSVQISVDLKAPDKPGTWKGEWKLRNDGGVLFGIGDGATGNFWVEIKIEATKYSLVDNYCKAEWRSGAGVLPCPGTSGDTRGFIIRQDAPKLENGSVENEPALWTNPQLVDNGFISGKFPALNITTGNHFKTVLGCLNGATNCKVKFTLKYSAEGGPETNLFEWSETYEGKLHPVDLDLSTLSGKSVVFILYLATEGPADQAQAFWLKPRIE